MSDSGSLGLTDLRTAKLTAQTDAGSVQVSGKALTATLRTDSGSITAEGLHTSDLTMRTESGGLRATCTRAPARVTATSDSGGVELALPGDRKYAVETRNDSGSKDVLVDQDSTSPYRVKVSTDSGSIRITKA